MINFEQFFLEQTQPQYVVVYPGRFQPMLKHHKAVYDKLVEEYGENSVYLATSDSVKLPKSPLSFAEKQQVMTQLMNIPADKVINVKVPYAGESYAHLGSSDSVLILAVGYKDQHPAPPDKPRFEFKNIDKSTGLNMKIKAPEPTFIQPYETLRDAAVPASQGRGYVRVMSDVVDPDSGAPYKASAFRQRLQSANNITQAKQAFFNYYGMPMNNDFDAIIEKLYFANQV